MTVSTQTIAELEAKLDAAKKQASTDAKERHLQFHRDLNRSHTPVLWKVSKLEHIRNEIFNKEPADRPDHILHISAKYEDSQARRDVCEEYGMPDPLASAQRATNSISFQGKIYEVLSNVLFLSQRGGGTLVLNTPARLTDQELEDLLVGKVALRLYNL